MSNNNSLLASNFERIDLPDADVFIYPQILADAPAAYYQKRLLDKVQWRQDEITLFGKQVKLPRLQAWFGDPGCEYRYSGLVLQPMPWINELLAIKVLVEQQIQRQFNAALLNLYRDGRDSMGWHSDDEPELGKQPAIASVSLGEQRAFKLRHKSTKQTVTIDLKSGSLLLMAGNTQQHWQHAIAKTTRAVSSRINITFRKINI